MGCDIHMFCEELKTTERKWVCTEEKLDVYRNYSMFTALCGVRDYTRKSPKISEPKGLPHDVTDIVKANSEYMDCDGHSHSYVTLREVKEFVEKNQPVNYSGLITQCCSDDLDKGILPTSWCQVSSDKTMVFREWEDNTFQPLEPLYELMCNKFKPDINPNEIDEQSLDDYRIVFWFDN